MPPRVSAHEQSLRAAQLSLPTTLSVASVLRLAGIDPVDCRLLLQHVLGFDHARLAANPEHVLDGQVRDRFLALLRRRVAGEPIAYILGRREFYGRDFRVDASVLIPRPETELLIDLALERVPAAEASNILDLGTGSGCIAITLALERPMTRVWAIDSSRPALAVARANASTLGTASLELLEGNWFEPVAGMTFDLIVGNPPYVAEGDAHLAQGDVRFEPRSALCAGSAGLDAIETIVAGAGAHLRPGGWLIFEHGHDQADPVRALLHCAGFEDCFCATDLARLPRVSGARKPNRSQTSWSTSAA
jgi:release factor glutamine methyltransferase